MENFVEIQDQIKQIVSKVEGPIYIFISSHKCSDVIRVMLINAH